MNNESNGMSAGQKQIINGNYRIEVEAQNWTRSLIPETIDEGSLAITGLKGAGDVCGLTLEYEVMRDGNVAVNVLVANHCDCSSHLCNIVICENKSETVQGSHGVYYRIYLWSTNNA